MKKKKKKRMTVEDFMKKLSSGEIRQSPIRRTSFTPEMSAAIHDVYDRVGRYHLSPYEKFELSFCRDMHPDREVAVWQLIAKAAEQYWAETPATDREETVSDLCLMSMGASINGRLQEIWLAVTSM